MRKPGLIGAALAGALCALLGGMTAGPALDQAKQWAEGRIRSGALAELRSRVDGRVELGPVRIVAGVHVTAERLEIHRSDGMRARVGSVSATLAPLPALVWGTSRGIATAQLRNVEMSAPASATPLGKSVSVTQGRLDVSRNPDAWQLEGRGEIAVGDASSQPWRLVGDTTGGVEWTVSGGLSVGAPGREGPVARIHRLRADPTDLRAVVSDIDFEGLPRGVEVSVGSVEITRARQDDTEGRSLLVGLRGLRVAVNSDHLDIGEITRLLRPAGPSATPGTSRTSGTSARPGNWRILAEDTALVLTRSGATHVVSPLGLELRSDGTVEVGAQAKVGGLGGAVGVRAMMVDRARGATGPPTLAFDAWVDDGTAEHPKLAPRPLGDITLRALGAARWMPERRRLEIDVQDGSARSARFSASLVAERVDDLSDLGLQLAVTLPAQPCQDLVGALPDGTLSTLRDLRLNGTFEGSLELSVDMRDVDNTLVLEGRGNPKRCQVVSMAGVDLAALNNPDFVHRWGSGDAVVEVGPGARGYVPLARIPKHVVRSMIVTEDGRFWGHRGVNLNLVKKALRINLNKGRYVYGGSTITQQLMKNLFLVRQKTMSRKIEEALLAMAAERVVPKRRLLELYVNVIEFGPEIYGISSASRFYFDSKPSQLTPIEGAFIASIKPKPSEGPRLARRKRFKGWWHHRLIEIMGWLEEGGYITPLERARAFPYYPHFRGPVLSAKTRPKPAGGKTAQWADPAFWPGRQLAVVASPGARAAP